MSEDKDFQVSSQAIVPLSVRQLMDNWKAHFSLEEPTRVLVLVRGNSKYHAEPDSVIIEHALSILDISGAQTLYLAREDWGRTIQFVFDVFHASYDFTTAHGIHDIAVVVVSLGGKNERRWFASRPQQQEVNETVAHIHDLNGWETRPPYLANHVNGAIPVYDNPRNMSDLPSGLNR